MEGISEYSREFNESSASRKALRDSFKSGSYAIYALKEECKGRSPAVSEESWEWFKSIIDGKFYI